MTMWETTDSAFSVARVNDSTFAIVEDDELEELPIIYVKIHPRARVLILSDTGSGYPSDDKKEAKYNHLGEFLENCPIKINNNKPLNHDSISYTVIASHCHYDHIGGIESLQEGGSDLIASAAGKNFIESDLETHGEFNHVGRPVPEYDVEYWAEAFDKLWFDSNHGIRLLSSADSVDEAAKLTVSACDCHDTGAEPIDLGITFIQTPGHTPDSLAWYDHDEKHLYVGDSLYEEGKEGMAIIWPKEGNLVEWAFSMQKLWTFVRSENAKSPLGDTEEDDDGWAKVPRRVRLGAAHQTISVDAEAILSKLNRFWQRILCKKVPVVHEEMSRGEKLQTWRDDGGDESSMSFTAPVRLMDQARRILGDPSIN